MSLVSHHPVLKGSAQPGRGGSLPKRQPRRPASIETMPGRRTHRPRLVGVGSRTDRSKRVNQAEAAVPDVDGLYARG